MIESILWYKSVIIVFVFNSRQHYLTLLSTVYHRVLDKRQTAAKNSSTEFLAEIMIRAMILITTQDGKLIIKPQIE